MSNEEVIRVVSASFVPVAVNLYKVRKLEDAGGKLFRSIQKQKDQFQGIWIVSPDGNVLSGYGDNRHLVFKDGDVAVAESQAAFLEAVRQTIATALESFGEVKPRRVQTANSLPHRGVGVQADGSVTLALHARYIAYHPLRSDADDHVNIDSLHLTAQQWSALAPPNAEEGAEWRLPESVARQFSRALCPVSDSDGWPQPGEVARARFTAKVDRIDQGVATLTYRGEISGVHVAAGQNAAGLKPGQPKPTFEGEARLTGLALYDTTRRELKALAFVFEGTYRRTTSADARPMAAVVEWRQRAPTTR